MAKLSVFVLLGAVALFVIASTRNATATSTEDNSINVPLLAAPPSMNGVIDTSWAPAAQIVLRRDFIYRTQATEPTVVLVAQDATSLDIAFAVVQKEPLTSLQATNGSSVLSNDYVAAYLYPRGVNGFAYSFAANPQGARYQTSSENSAYAPQWTAVGRITSYGYVVTMRIPLNVIRTGGSTSWKVQFVRSTVAAKALSVWTYSNQETSFGDPFFAGTLSGIGMHGIAAQRPKPRVQVYALGELTTPAYGGDTSRAGLDLAWPVTQTSSFVATLHPDNSDVEIDQQTIAPSAFARQYAEVRPFFTQAASFFNQRFMCPGCPQTLYTPAIPDFGQGYAYEGTQGPLSFAAFDAIGPGRTDDAQTLNYSSEDQYGTVRFSAQRVGVDIPGLTDDAEAFSGGYLNLNTHLGASFDYGEDQQNGSAGPTAGTYLASNLEYTTPTTTAILTALNVGTDFLPLDGYVTQTDISGYQAFATHRFTFSPSYILHSIYVESSYARFVNSQGLPDQVDGSETVVFAFRNLMSAFLSFANQGIGVNNGTPQYQFLPFNSNTFLIGYKMRTTTPSYVSYTGGPYYNGHLNAWSYVSTRPLVRKVNISLEADNDRYFPSTMFEPVTNQWLERASLDWQITSDAEVSVGVRRIIGSNLPNAFEPFENDPAICVADPYLPGCSLAASNVSVAYHFLAAHNEFYAVYGDPNSLSTTPAVLVKWIRYIGAEKGT